MIPAVESRFDNYSVGDISRVPAVRVTVESGKGSVVCVGVVDTGADLSILDEGIFQRLGTQVPRIPGRALAVGFSGKRVVMYQLSLTIRGDSGGGEFRFGDVPVAVSALGRPVLVLGRRGVLEWLRVEIDFPRGAVTLVRCHRLTERYPALARALPAFEEAAALLEGGALLQGITILSMELERFCDRGIARDDRLRRKLARKPLARATLGEKLAAVCELGGFQELMADVNTIVEHRNIAAHAADDALATLSAHDFLAAAERVVDRLFTCS